MDFLPVATLLLMTVLGGLCSYIGYCAGREDGNEEGYKQGYFDAQRTPQEYFSD